MVRLLARLVVRPLWGRLVAGVLAAFLSGWAVIDAFLPPDISNPVSPSWKFPHLDKLIHFTAYGLLALLAMQAACGLSRAVPGPSPAAAPRLLSRSALVWLLATGISALAEAIQYHTGRGRNAELADIVASASGALAACVLFGLAWFVADKAASQNP
jgi:VanZ family protein